MRFVVYCAFLLLCLTATAQITPKPIAVPLPLPVPEPRDQAFRGTLHIRVDATDTAHGVFRVTETLPIQAPGEMVLLYPQWETTSHSPTASAVELAGLRMQIDGRNVDWHRDICDVHAFHLEVPTGSRTLTLCFEYLSPRSSAELRRQMVKVDWPRLLLYPAGWYTVTLPLLTPGRYAIHISSAYPALWTISRRFSPRADSGRHCVRCSMTKSQSATFQ
ncbi:MAG: hypothetical protein ABSD72_06495 [Terracidiphilus sp.]